MSAIVEINPQLLVDDRLARRNAMVLALAQALGGVNNTVIFSTSSIVGAVLAPNKGLATLPITAFVLGMWLGTLPVGVLARHFGRRFALHTGTLCGVLSGLICYVAVIDGAFFVLLVGTFCGGIYAAAMLSYRFAAADTASESYRSRVVSWVLVGGVFAAVLGPQLVIFTQNLLTPYTFAASYLGQTACAVAATLVLVFVKIPQSAAPSARQARPIFKIVRAPRFLVAAACGVTAYGMMNLLMTSAPLAMVGCGHSVTDATLAIQWHVLAMYTPSFITGSLVARYGIPRITGLGLAMIGLAAAIGISGLTVVQFWVGLIFLGLGWNFTFIGATTLVTECYRPEERNKVQAFNDFLIFGSMAVTSFSSGQMLAAFGWAAVNALIFPVVLVAGTLLIWLAVRQRDEAETV